MANLRHISIYLSLACQTLVAVGQSVEQECNILKTLDNLSKKVKQLESSSSLAEQLKSLSKKFEQLESSSAQAEQLKSLSKKFEQLESSIAQAERMKSLSKKFEQLETKFKDLTQNSGSTYTRWGRKSCPGNGSELVYSGYVGGSHYDHVGAAVDYLCLPKDPIFGHYYEDKLQRSGYVYGAEYELYHVDDIMAFFPNIDASQDLLDRDVPCAVCLTQRTRVMMVPARNMCHDGWTLEYKGYLSCGHHSMKAATQYVCLDDEPEFFDGGQQNKNGKLFFFVEGRCGSLKCPPYVDGRELTCAICSK